MDETYPAPAAGELSGEGEGASPEDQAALIERIKLGDVELFLKLIQPHGKTLHAVCHSILQNDADAEEVAQETLLKALAHLEQLRTYQSFKSWLFQIAINEARRRLREQRFYSPVPLEPGQPDADEADFAPVDFADWRDIPSVTLERKELWAAVSQALRGLEGIYREVFVLRDMQHLTTSEAAAVLAISEASVTTRLHRARLQMREQLAPLFARPRTGWVPLRVAMDRANGYMRMMMGCAQVVPQLTKYIDGNLDPDQRRKIERHLRLCRYCAVLLDSIRKLLYIVGDDKVFAPPFGASQHWEEGLSGLIYRARPPTKAESGQDPQN